MKIIKAEYITSAVELLGLLKDDKPQFAFVGRSNVGKSSLINALSGKKNLAKTSSTPGLTKMVNYFLINDSFFILPALILFDLLCRSFLMLYISACCLVLLCLN